MKMLPKKAGAIVLLTIFLAGCALRAWIWKDSNVATHADAIEAAKPATELTFVFAEGDEGGRAAMVDMVARFNNSHDNIVIHIKSGGSGAYDELLKTMESVGEFPDILETTNVAAYIRAGILAELPEDIIALFTEVTEFNGKVYTAPHTGSNTIGIIYNKDYFDSHGFIEPKTYDAFLSLCEKIYRSGDIAPLAIGAKDLWHIGFWFNKIYNDQVISNDPDFIVHCYEGTKDFTDASFQAVFSEMGRVIRYAQPDWATTPDSKVTEYFLDGKAAMVYTGRHLLSKLEQQNPGFELGWFSIPSPDGKLRMVGGSAGDGLAISAQAAQDPAKKAAAEEFLRFFFSKENYGHYCQALNIVPTTVDAPDIHFSSVAQEVLSDLSKADSIGPAWNAEFGVRELPADFRNVVYEKVVEVLQGKLDAESACIAINEVWQQSTQDFNPLTGAGIVMPLEE